MLRKDASKAKPFVLHIEGREVFVLKLPEELKDIYHLSEESIIEIERGDKGFYCKIKEGY